MDIFFRVKKFNLPMGEYAVFGSSLLDVWGIRKAQDLDIIVTPELFEYLRSSGEWQEKQANGFSMLVKEDANVTTVQNKPTDGEYCPDRRQLIKNAVVIQGMPFVRIEEVLACKKDYDREKDQRDIQAIEEYLKSKENEDIYADPRA